MFPHYTYHTFNIPSIIICLSTLLLYATLNNIKKPNQKYLLIYIILNISSVLTSIAITYNTNSYNYLIPISLNLLYTFYFLIGVSKGFFFYLYLNKRLTLNSKNLVFYLSIPAYIAILMLLTNSKTHYLFSLVSFKLQHGPLFLLIYVHYFIYTIAFIVLIIKGQINYSRNSKLFMTLFISYLIIFAIINNYTTSIQPINLLSSMLLFLIFTTLETPMQQESKKTGTLSFDTFENFINSLEKEHIKFILIKINNIEVLNTFEEENIVASAYYRAIKAIKKKFKHSYFFSITSSILAVSIPASIDSKTFIDFIYQQLIEYKQRDKNASSLSLTFAKSKPLQDFDDTTAMYNSIKYGIELLNNSKGSKICYLLSQNESDLYIRQQKIYRKLHQAITNKLIELKIQPIFDVKKNKLSKGEVLSRLQIPEIGYVPSSEFISMAEKNGSINEFGIAVFSELCHILSTVVVKVEQLSFNISMYHFMQSSLPEDLLKIVHFYNIDPKLLIIEITETSKVLDWQILKKNMKTLKEAGFTLSLDDFGTGFASLEYFVSLPFDIIKFDRNLLLASQESKTAYKALFSTIKMVKDLGYSTVIEGVETEKQKEIALSMNVDYIQGFLYGKPTTMSDFIKIVNKQD